MRIKFCIIFLLVIGLTFTISSIAIAFAHSDMQAQSELIVILKTPVAFASMKYNMIEAPAISTMGFGAPASSPAGKSPNSMSLSVLATTGAESGVETNRKIPLAGIQVASKKFTSPATRLPSGKKQFDGAWAIYLYQMDSGKDMAKIESSELMATAKMTETVADEVEIVVIFGNVDVYSFMADYTPGPTAALQTEVETIQKEPTFALVFSAIEKMTRTRSSLVIYNIATG